MRFGFYITTPIPAGQQLGLTRGGRLADAPLVDTAAVATLHVEATYKLGHVKERADDEVWLFLQ